jgi:COP9 signalosome complex subunit 7
MASELEQFCILAKAQKGRACAALVQQVLSSRKIFTFGELLSIPSVASLADTEHVKYFKTLQLFAYGVWSDYRESTAQGKGDGPTDYIELSETQVMKLKQLTIVQLADSDKIIPYPVLLRELDITNVRELEDLIIETIYCGVVSGKIDQQKGIFRVKWTIGRDVAPSKLSDIITTLGSWGDRCRSTLAVLEDSSNRIRVSRDIGRDEQEKGTRIVEEMRSRLKESIASGELRGAGDSDEDGDEGIPRRTAPSISVLNRRSRAGKRTRGVASGGGSMTYPPDDERMDMDD